jgi:putative ABC transport system permease protein
LVLLIAAANIASLMLARMTGRAHELGVRAALGATRGRLVRQLLTESLILSLAGGVLGLLIALWGKDVLLTMWPSGATKPTVAPLEVRSLLFTFVAAVLVGGLVGIAPALRGASADVAGSLRAGAVRRTGILRSVLVVLQHAVAIVLLVGAALFGKSLIQLLSQKPGFDPQNVITMNISPAAVKYPDKEHIRQLYEAIVDRLRTTPGVVSASAISNIPFGRSNTGGTFTIEGRPEFPTSNRPQATKFVVEGEFFRTMRIPLLAGRTFTPADKEVKIIINKTFAERYFPGESPLGKRMDVWGGFAEIVGVVGDIRRQGLDDPPELQTYLNLAIPMPWTSFVIRASGDPTKLFAATKAQVFAVDPDQPVYAVGTLDDMIAQSASSRRGLASLVGGFAAVALLLSALGIYGVLSYSVSQRTREIGVRMALGAQTRSVLQLILGQGMLLAGIGAAIGLILAVALALLLRSFLFEVSPLDPVVYMAVAGVLLGVGALACFVPARRAARLDPMTVLRRD